MEFAQNYRLLSFCTEFIHYMPAMRERGNTVRELESMGFASATIGPMQRFV